MVTALPVFVLGFTPGSFGVEARNYFAVLEMAAYVKGFGCRPDLSVDLDKGAGVGKPPKNEPAGQW